MNARRELVCRRWAPSAVWPIWTKAVRMPSSRPNSRNAAMIEASVRNVRALRRNSAAQMRCMYFMAALCSCRVGGLLDQHALVPVQRVRRVFGGPGIVGDHHDGLAVLAVELLQQAQDLLGGLAVQVAGGLVADQQGRVGDDRAGDRHPLLLAAGKF